MASLSLDPHQHTLKKSVSCNGVGLHSGNEINLTIKPAPENSGIHFFRTDLDDTTGVPAHMDKVVDTRLATTIADAKVMVSTTEHLMAALQGFGVDNANIELDGAEVPIMDGSAGDLVWPNRPTPGPTVSMSWAAAAVLHDAASTTDRTIGRRQRPGMVVLDPARMRGVNS